MMMGFSCHVRAANCYFIYCDRGFTSRKGGNITYLVVAAVVVAVLVVMVVAEGLKSLD